MHISMTGLFLGKFYKTYMENGEVCCACLRNEIFQKDENNHVNNVKFVG